MSCVKSLTTLSPSQTRIKRSDTVESPKESQSLVTEQNSMIVRTWSATATPSGAWNYRRYFAGTLLAQLRNLPGFAGGYLLSRDLDNPEGTIEVTALTFWQSVAAIKAFAGEDITVSIVEPEAQAFLLNFDATATHHNLWVDGRT